MENKVCIYTCMFFLLKLNSISTAPAEDRSENSPVGKFWHISDLHLDPSYHITDDRTKVCFSSKGFPASNPGLFGDFMCDSPYELILSAFEFMKQLPEQADFIIWTGDNPPHVPAKELSTATVIQLIANVTSTIRKFFPDLPVFPALGNHDYWPQDQLPTSTNEIYQAAAGLWQPWLKAEAMKTLREGGYYSQLARPGLRVVSLNTNLYYSPDKATVNMSDPAGQFSWLVHTLETCRRSDEMVYIIAHVPVGYLPYALNTTAMREVHNERLVQIFRKYSDIIAGQFYGHTHRDSIMVLLDEQGKAVNSLFVAPAVTPIKSMLDVYSNNPGVRMYQYCPQDYSMQNVFQFFLNLTEANEEKKANWSLEYSMTEAFNIKDVQPHSLQKLAKSFATPQSTAFQKYFNHFMVSYNDSIVCRGICKLIQLCSVQFLDLATYSECLKRKSGAGGVHDLF